VSLLREDSTVQLHLLHIGDRDQDGHEVGRPDTGVFVSVPPEGVALLSWLQAGLSLGEVENRFLARYGQRPNLDDFLTDLEQCGFVRHFDGQAVEDDTGLPTRREWYLLAGLRQERVAWLLSRPMVALYAAVWLGAIALTLTRPDLLPSPAEARLHPRVMLNAVALALVGWALVFLHEVAHVVLARAVGCPSSLSLGHRLNFLVAQTDLTALRAQPRSRRYGPYLAGVTWDVFLLLGCMLLGAGGVRSPVLSALATLTLMGIGFQFAFFMRTDIYYVFVNWLRLGNLVQDTRQWLANCLLRLVGRPQRYDLTAVPARELRVIRWYALFCTIGVAVVLGDFVLLGLPLVVPMLWQAVHGLAVGPAGVAFWDGILFLALSVLNLVMLLAVSWRDWKARRLGTG
jgi:putative peptide zinc metalloprotease protein